MTVPLVAGGGPSSRRCARAGVAVLNRQRSLTPWWESGAAGAAMGRDSTLGAPAPWRHTVLLPVAARALAARAGCHKAEAQEWI